MQLSGAGVVVTGGGGGIGGALACRFAAEGARVVVGKGVGAETGGRAVVGDAASPDGVRRLIESAREELGAIDMFCANAGIVSQGGPEAPEEVWARTWEINVMAHVRAANPLLPDWLARGQGTSWPRSRLRGC